ncbi:MAG: hypothetical protein SGPRY_007226 [Prymnesium sp.]
MAREVPPLCKLNLFVPSLKQHSHTGYFVFDRQARPHLILTCRSLTGKALGLPSGTKPSFWNLTPELQATLLQAMLRVAHDVGFRRLEVHLGSWVSSYHIHAHIQMPLVPYFQLRAAHQGMSKWTLHDVKQRKSYVENALQSAAFFHEQDGPAAREIVESEIPQLTADLSAFDSVDFDSDLSGTAGIDVIFKNAPVVKKMQLQELQNAMEAVQQLCLQLKIDGAFLLLPAPASGAASQDNHQESVARIMCRPDQFVCCLSPERRKVWYEVWAAKKTVLSNKDDLSLLPAPANGHQA